MSKRNYLIDVPVFPIIFFNHKQGWMDGSRISETGGWRKTQGVPTYYLANFSKSYMKMKEIGSGGGIPKLCISATDKKKLHF